MGAHSVVVVVVAVSSFYLPLALPGTQFAPFPPFLYFSEHDLAALPIRIYFNMFLRRGSRAFRRQWQTFQGIARVADPQTLGAYYVAARDFHSTRKMGAVKPVLLADIGEGTILSFLAVRILEAHTLLS